MHHMPVHGDLGGHEPLGARSGFPAPDNSQPAVRAEAKRQFPGVAEPRGRDADDPAVSLRSTASAPVNSRRTRRQAACSSLSSPWATRRAPVLAYVGAAGTATTRRPASHRWISADGTSVVQALPDQAEPKWLEADASNIGFMYLPCGALGRANDAGDVAGLRRSGHHALQRHDLGRAAQRCRAGEAGRGPRNRTAVPAMLLIRPAPADSFCQRATAPASGQEDRRGRRRRRRSARWTAWVEQRRRNIHVARMADRFRSSSPAAGCAFKSGERVYRVPCAARSRRR